MILDSLLNLRAADVGTLANPSELLFSAFGMVPSEAGVLISERNAVGLSAVWTCVNIRAGLMASLPLNLYARSSNGTRRLADNRKEYRILHDRPSPEDTSYSFRHKLAVNWLLWGNAYAQIEIDGRGALRYLWPYHPSQVRVEYGSQRGEYHYIVTGQGADGYVQQKVLPEDMLHLRGFCFEGVEGISTIQNYRRGLGLAVAREVFQSNFVKSGVKTAGILQLPGRLTPEAQKNLEQSFEKKYAGSANAGKTIVLEEGAKYIPTTMPLADAEFLASIRMSRAEIAGLFRIPPMLVPGSDDKAPTYSSSEIFNRQLVDYTLRDDVSLWQDELSSKLFPDGDHFCEFDLKDLLRADAAGRADYWFKRWQMGSLTADEVRADENENPLPNGIGKKTYIQSGYVDASLPPVPAKSTIDPGPANPEPSPDDPARSKPNGKPKPGQSGAMGSGFRALFGNVVSELKGWEVFSAKRASAKLRGLLIDPIAAELNISGDDVFLASCADALALRVRAIEPEQVDGELHRLAMQIEAGAISATQ